ncbi:hypothetical protein [Nocardioides sp.]|uniref:hypothetical protein n=1 Tax=Nocardioides sp. TaxID=35761 RepID=UPI003784700B
MAAPPGEIHLHVGMPKTGTTYLQSVFLDSRAELERQGLELAPRGRPEAAWLSRAVRDAAHPRRDPPAARGVLDRFAEQVATSAAPRVLVSEEQLGAATEPQVRRLVDACGDREVHLVLTVRSLARLLPSTWQQRVQQGSRTPDLDTFLDEVASRRGRIAERWWFERGVEAVVDRWSTGIPLARIHVVTVPRGPSEVLLERFCAVLGVDPGRLSTGTARPNASLGRVQAEVLRRVGEQVPRKLVNRHDYVPVGKGWLGQRHLAEQGGAPPRMPERLRAWCEEEAERSIAMLRDRGVQVSGDLDDLRPDDGAFDDGVPPDPEELAAAAVRALASVAIERVEGRKRARAGGDPPREEPRVRRLLRRSRP